MTEEHWQWQEPGTAWRGIGIYHITLTVPSRQPLLGKLVIPDNDPSQARVERTALGNAVIDELYVMCKHYPAIRIFQFCLMPDHLHAVIQVTRVMDTSIRSWLHCFRMRRQCFCKSKILSSFLQMSAKIYTFAVTDV